MALLSPTMTAATPEPETSVTATAAALLVFTRVKRSSGMPDAVGDSATVIAQKAGDGCVGAPVFVVMGTTSCAPAGKDVAASAKVDCSRLCPSRTVEDAAAPHMSSWGMARATSWMPA